MERTGSSHTDSTESTDNTEILGFKFQDSSFRSRRKRRERRILMVQGSSHINHFKRCSGEQARNTVNGSFLVDFPLRAVELNLHGSSHINHFKRCSGEQARNTVNGSWLDEKAERIMKLKQG